VEDNGIGREKALEIKKVKQQNHQSLGTSITRDRITAIETMARNNMKIEYVDLKDYYEALLNYVVQTVYHHQKTNRKIIHTLMAFNRDFVITELNKLIMDQSTYGRPAASIIMGWTGFREFLPGLKKIATTPKEILIEKKESSGPSGISGALEAQHERTYEELRQTTFRSIAEIEGKKAYDFFIEALSIEKQPEILLEIVRSLGIIGNPQAYQHLADLIWTDKARVKFNSEQIGKIIESIGKLNNPEASDPLFEFLQNGKPKSARGSAAIALAYLNDHRAESIFIDKLKNASLYLGFEKSLITALGIMKSEQALPLFTNFAEKVPLVELVRALGKMPHSSEVESSLITILASRNKLKTPGAVLGDEREPIILDLGMTTIETLETLRLKGAIPALLGLVDQEYEVSKRAVRAVEVLLKNCK